jgi:uncharacterized protein (TIGR03790 family)
MARHWITALVLLGVGLLPGCSGAFLTPLTEAVAGLGDPDRLTAQKLAIVVNQNDPLSQKIAAYYQFRRQIPAANIVRVRFNPDASVLGVDAFQTIWAEVQRQTPDSVQAYVLTWAQPYRVGCMSITAAFTFGFSETYCARGCQPTAISPYFNSDRTDPFDTFQMRPTMALAARDFSDAIDLIERGIAADGQRPTGTAYLLDTDDADRNVRSRFYNEVETQLGPFFHTEIVQDNQLIGRLDVMFYFTGLAKVPAIDSNQYRPGAVADHLTSLGGKLTDSPQMSSLDWLEAGATGSYGAVVEPCNFPQKFPHPGVLMAHYLNGDTLMEAYWKSVLWPGQGIFIGEPLARPFAD